MLIQFQYFTDFLSLVGFIVSSIEWICQREALKIKLMAHAVEASMKIEIRA